jgi:multiple sugar transport system substrate-binding protein
MDTQTKYALNRINRRRFLQAVGAAGALAVSGDLLAACGGAGLGGSNQITLQQWYHEYGEAGTQQAVLRYAADYTKSTSTNIKISWIPGAYADKLSTVLLSNNPPDVFEHYTFNDNWAKQGLLEPLDDLYTPDTKSDFNPVNLASFTVDGKIYGVKMFDDTEFFYYRKSLLSQAGIDPTTLTSWDALLEAGKKLTTSKTKGLFLGNDGGIALYQLAVYSTGGDLVANNQIAFNTPEVVAAFEKMREVATSSTTLTGAPTDWLDPSAFINGLTAIQWCGIWALPAVIKALGDDFGIIPWPAFGTRGKPTVPWGGFAEMVCAKSKHIAESKALVKSLWIDNTAVQQDFCLSYGFHVPSRESVAAKATKLQSGPAAEAVKLLNSYGRTNPPLFSNTMNTALNDAVSNIVKSNANAASEVTKAAQTCSTELQQLLG